MEINFLPKVRVTEMYNFVVFTVGRSMCDWMRLYFYVATILFSWPLANMGALCDLCCCWSARHCTYVAHYVDLQQHGIAVGRNVGIIAIYLVSV